MTYLILGILGGLLNVYGFAVYVKDILKKQAKPSIVTWLIWSILSGIAAINQIKNEGGYSIIFVLVNFIGALTVFLMSLYRHDNKVNILDKVCLFLSGLLIIYYLISQDSYYSTIMVVAIDLLGLIPTLTKTYLDPKSETYTIWVTASIGILLTIISIENRTFIIYLYPAYILLADSSIVGLKFFGERNTPAK